MNYEEAYKELLNKYEKASKELESIKDAYHTADQIVKHSNRALAIINLNREIIWMNERAEDQFGFSFGEVKGKKIFELLVDLKTDFSMIPQALESVKNGCSVESTYLVYKKDRTEMWVRVQMSPLYNRKSEIDKVAFLAQDISQEKEIFLKAEEGEKRHKLLLKHTPDIIYNIDLQGKLLEINDAWTRVLGYSKEETFAKDGNYFFFPADVEKAKAARQTLVDGTALSYNIDVRVVAKNGEIVWLNTTSFPIYSKTHEIIGFTGMSKNITTQKRNQTIRELLSIHVRDLVCMHDKDTNYIYVSPSIKEIAGYEPQELVGKSSFDFYHPDDIEKIWKYREANIKGNVEVGESVQLRFRKKEGTYTWLELTGKIFDDSFTGSMAGVTVCKVVDKKKEEEKKILAALEDEKKLNRLKTGFLQFVSHEFKTPLSIIKALCEMIKVGTEDNQIDVEQLTKDVDCINTEVDGLSEMIDEVLVLEELESGNLNLRFRSQSIQSIITDINERLSFKNKKEMKASIRVIGTPQSVQGDRKYLALIFRNLLSNAYKYSERRPSPVVTINFYENQCVVSVKDFGIGIPQEELKNLFSNFYRASNVGKIEGTGLGLSLVKRFVEMHSGTIVCHSKEDEGTEMVVSLPIVFTNEG